MEDAGIDLAPTGVLHHLHRNERLQGNARDAVVLRDAVLVDSEQVCEQAAVGDVDLWRVDRPSQEARPRWTSSMNTGPSKPARNPAGSDCAVSRAPLSSMLTVAAGCSPSAIDSHSVLFPIVLMKEPPTAGRPCE